MMISWQKHEVSQDYVRIYFENIVSTSAQYDSIHQNLPNPLFRSVRKLLKQENVVDKFMNLNEESNDIQDVLLLYCSVVKCTTESETEVML